MTELIVLVSFAVVPVVTVVYVAGGRRAMQNEARRTIRALHRLQAVVDACRDDPTAAADAVTVGLDEVLHLRACHYEAMARDDDPLPAIRPDGDVDAMVLHRIRSGIVLPERCCLPVGRGRFVLAADPSTGTSVEERVIAATMASLVGNVPAGFAPGIG